MAKGSSDVGRVASSTGNTSSGIPLFGPVPLKPIDLSPYMLVIIIQIYYIVD